MQGRQRRHSRQGRLAKCCLARQACQASPAKGKQVLGGVAAGWPGRSLPRSGHRAARAVLALRALPLAVGRWLCRVKGNSPAPALASAAVASSARALAGCASAKRRAIHAGADLRGGGGGGWGRHKLVSKVAHPTLPPRPPTQTLPGSTGTAGAGARTLAHPHLLVWQRPPACTRSGASASLCSAHAPTLPPPPLPPPACRSSARRGTRTRSDQSRSTGSSQTQSRRAGPGHRRRHRQRAGTWWWCPAGRRPAALQWMGQKEWCRRLQAGGGGGGPLVVHQRTTTIVQAAAAGRTSRLPSWAWHAARPLNLLFITHGGAGARWFRRQWSTRRTLRRRLMHRPRPITQGREAWEWGGLP